tara:strand:+ start:2804 stop:3871 length:1068 start_codon:yes stop_codon:yes gene_type:complete
LNIIRLKKILDPEIPILSSNLRNKIKFNLRIADVGSSGLPPEEFFSIFNKSIFYCFDPDSRARKSSFSNIIFHSNGLFSSKTEKKIYLTNMPDASSLHKPNKDFLNKFLNASASDVVKEETINLTTLDLVLNEDEKIDFLKVDVEGADLEVIKGGDESLSDCLGIKIEVQFKERNIGSPLFSEIDDHLKKNYFLLDLKNSSWLKSKVHFINSNAEIVWGDAYYLKNEESFLKNYSQKSSDDKENFLLRYIVIGSLLGAHDHLIHFLNNNFDKLDISETDKIYYIKGILASKKNILVQVSISFLISCSFSLFYLLFFPNKYFRKKFSVYLRKNVSFLGKVLIFLSRNLHEGTITKN